MPILRYRTGDLMEFTSTKDQIRFRLLGRTDKRIDIWTSRFYYSDIKKVLTQLGYAGDFQVILETNNDNDKLHDTLTLCIDHEFADLEPTFIKEFHYYTDDVRTTIELDFLVDKIHLSHTPLETNSRTGKVSKVIDLRK